MVPEDCVYEGHQRQAGHVRDTKRAEDESKISTWNSRHAEKICKRVVRLALKGSVSSRNGEGMT